MLSVGGIPGRTRVRATVSPLGSGTDDTPNIQNAINACPLGQVVQLAAGTFTIADGNYVALNKGITLRGAGPGVTILQRTNGATLGSYISGSKPSPMVIVGPQRYNNNQTATALAADATNGTYSVQVTSTSGFSVDQMPLLTGGELIECWPL
jgi:polygalacturonase